MYKHIDVDKVLSKLYSKCKSDDLLSEFSRMSNLLKIKDSDAYNMRREYSTRGYRYCAMGSNIIRHINTPRFVKLASNSIDTYVKKNDIKLDNDRYLLCIPESFVNFVLCEKYKNIETHYKKVFLYENRLAPDHIINDREKSYLFMKALQENNIRGTVYLYNVDKSWYVPVLSNEGEKIFGIGRTICSSNTKGHIDYLQMDSQDILKNIKQFNAQSKNEFTENDLIHLSYIVKDASFMEFIKGIRQKTTFMGNPATKSDKSLENIKSSILDAMYDK